MENCEQILKNLGGILGAVNMDYEDKAKNLIRLYKLSSWRADRFEDIIRYLLDQPENKKFKETIERQIKQIKEKSLA